MPDIRHFTIDTPAQTIADAIKEDGAVILDNVISPEFIAALREETDPYMEGLISVLTTLPALKRPAPVA